MTIPHKAQGAIALAALLAVAPLAGCSKSDSSSSSSTTPAVVAPSQAATLPASAKFKGKSVGAVADVKIDSCPTDAGEQTAKLTVTNSTKAARDYAIMVIWLKNDSGTPVGATMIKQKAAAPGKKIAVSGKAKVTTKADKCVLNVMAGTLA